VKPINSRDQWVWRNLDETWEAEAASIREERDEKFPNLYEVVDTDIRWCGELGEMVFNDWLKFEKHVAAQWHLDDPAGNADFTLPNGTTVGVKTVKRKVEPRPHYEAQVSRRHADEPVDYYFFLTYQFLTKRMWLLGGMDRASYLQQARFLDSGAEVHPNYRIRPGHAIYNLEIGRLTPSHIWLEEAIALSK